MVHPGEGQECFCMGKVQVKHTSWRLADQSSHPAIADVWGVVGRGVPADRSGSSLEEMGRRQAASRVWALRTKAQNSGGKIVRDSCLATESWYQERRGRNKENKNVENR